MIADSKDDIVTAEMAMPVNREIHLLMHAKDVGHSFFVRELRIQQDFVPGARSLGSFHRDQDRQVRDRLHAALWAGALQHEGVSRVYVAGRLRQLAEEASGDAVSRSGTQHKLGEANSMHETCQHTRRTITPARPAFIRKYIFSLDHKVIGEAVLRPWLWWRYSSAWCCRGSCGFIWRGRSCRSQGCNCFRKTGAPGDIMTPEYYLQLMTMHGTIMVFFVLTTAPFAAFGNYFLPIQIGAEDMPFPHFNMMSFWMTFVGLPGYWSRRFSCREGPPLSGWTAYAPLSAVGEVAGPGQGTGQSSVGAFDRNLLRRPVAGLLELHRHHTRSALQGHDA